MPNDYVTLKALASELNEGLSGGRIDRIAMPDGEELTLLIRARSQNQTLFISAKTNAQRIYLTSDKQLSPAVPPAFCMTLRKHLYGGVIELISLLNEDRLFELTIAARNELNDLKRYRLIAEMTGGGANVILADEDYTVIDCLKRITEGKRLMLPRTPYSPPLKNKISLLDGAAIETLISEHGGDELSKLLYYSVNGLSKESAAELALFTSGGTIAEAARAFDDLKAAGKFSPCVRLQNGSVKGFYAYPYRSAGEDAEWQNTASLSDACALFYGALSEEETRKRASAGAAAILASLRKKNRKKAEENRRKLAECAQTEHFLRLGEILKCHAGAVIAQGASIINCYDFYNNQDIAIPVDPLLTVMENAKRYFKKYAKLKGAESYAERALKDAEDDLAYLDSVAVALRIASRPADFQAIESELRESFGEKKPSPNAKKKKEKPKKKPSPLSLEIDGYRVYIGRNNSENDEATFGIASGGDLWLHVKNYHGAHGIIIARNAEVPARVISKAASAVAYFSGARSAPKADVDYTKRKYVKKLGRPGMVTYSEYKTVTVIPEKPVI